MDLFFICIAAMLAVFFLLGILAILMWIIVLIFPPTPKDDPTIYLKALEQIYQKNFPNMKITDIEEMP